MSNETKTIEVTWSEDRGGRLHAHCPEDHTQDSNVIEWPTPLGPDTDSWDVAHRVIEVTGATKIVSVDHDKETIFVVVEA